jgi:subtilase family serine protease
MNGSGLITLLGNTRPEATQTNDRGPVADNLAMDHMLMQLKRSLVEERAMDMFLDSLHDPKSPNYHHWLTAEEFGERFGESQTAIQEVTTWLESNGFTVNGVFPSRMAIDFSGSASQIRTAFHTSIHRLLVNGQAHIANTSDPTVPEAIARSVSGIVSMHDFRPQPLNIPRAPQYTFSPFGSLYEGVVPADLATIYNINPVFEAGISGQGQTIAVIENTDLYSNSDWTAFRKAFKLSQYATGTLTTVHPEPKSGPHNCADPGVVWGNDLEAALDAEWASAAAPSAGIVVASCRDTTTFGGLLALENLLNSPNPPGIVSLSYGECEAGLGAAGNAAYSAAYSLAVAEGVSVFVSSGDSGAAACDNHQYWAYYGVNASGMASTPYNVAVGGTDFGDAFAHTTGEYWNLDNSPEYASALSYIPEIPWNDSCASTLLALAYTGSPASAGPNGFCNSSTGEYYISTAAGSGAPSTCANGTTSLPVGHSGSCAGYPKPSWQKGILGNPNDGVRDLPDVSLFAANGVWGHFYVFCYSDPFGGGWPCSGPPSTWSFAGGTSFSSPIMAGIQSLINQKTGSLQGNPNYVYYQLANQEYGSTGSDVCNSTNGNVVGSSCTFYDVTLGDNDVVCSYGNNCYGSDNVPNHRRLVRAEPWIYGILSVQMFAAEPAYPATTGWDFATGIGTVNVANLVSHWPMQW